MVLNNGLLFYTACKNESSKYCRKFVSIVLTNVIFMGSGVRKSLVYNSFPKNRHV